MEDRIKAINSALTQLYKSEDELYHRYGVFFSLSDPAVWVLYGLFEDPARTMTQNDLVSTWFYPKQTINYTVAALVKKGWVELKQLPVAGNSKAVILTEEGERVGKERILPLMRAEEATLKRMTEDEREQLLALTRKKFGYFEQEIAKITGDTKKESK